MKVIVVGCLLMAGLLLTSCQTTSKAEADALSTASVDCVQREAALIAPKPVDLETAAAGVLARCNAEFLAQDKASLKEYPGYETEVRQGLAKLNAARLEQARRSVALIRVR